MPFQQLSKIQKKDHARILRSALPPEIEARIRVRAAQERAETARAAVELADAQAALKTLMDDAYKRTLADRIKAEQAARLLKNAEKFS